MSFKTVSDLCDVVTSVIICDDDNTILLTINNTEYSLPFSKAVPGQAWEKIMEKDLVEFFGLNPVNKILMVCKTWVANRNPSQLLNTVLQGNVNAAVKAKAKHALEKYRGKYRWVNEQELKKLLAIHSLISPDIVEYFNIAKGSPSPLSYYPDEAFVLNNLYETTEEILVFGKGDNFYQLVEASGIDKLAQETLVKYFVLLTFPSNYMNWNTFNKLMMDLGWQKSKVPHLFRSADIKNRIGLSYRELLYFLACIDPNTFHGGSAAEMRCKYMFKYYDRDKDDYLKKDELLDLISDIRKNKKQSTDATVVENEAAETYRSMAVEDGTPVSLADFLKAVCSLKIRGTSMLFRSSVGIVQLQRTLSNVLSKTSLVGNFSSKGNANLAKLQKSNTKLSFVKSRVLNYVLAVHSLRIQKDGLVIDIDDMKQIPDALSATTFQQPWTDQTRRTSVDIFSQRSVSNELLRGLRYLISINKIKDQKAMYSWGQLDPLSHAKNLINVCQQVKEYFKIEPRLIEVSSPVYILGDLHGNVADLLYFESVLWRVGPGLCPSNLLFLGDYVDRGTYGLEVVSYLLAYKLQAPNKVYMLRGNHEIRDVQNMFTFHKECVLKLGEKVGNEVWTSINDVFDTVPIAAVVDGKIFCCHGGVPPPWLCPAISAIDDIPVPLTQPDVQSSLAWELMWNDPVRSNAITDKLTMELLANEGFAVNTRRGTAHVFSVDALEKFLRANQLSYFIRAHEVAKAGFQVLQKGKLISVFSSSKYCGGKNDAACIMADQGKLRVIRLEMSKN